jgi:hypothetical protein
MRTNTTTQLDPVAAITEALTRRKLLESGVLKVEGRKSVGSPPVTVWEEKSGLHASLDPPNTFDNSTEAWRMSVFLEVWIQFNEADPERVSRLHEATAKLLRGLSFATSHEEISDIDPDDGCQAHQSEWVIEVSAPGEVAQLIEQLLVMQLAYYPDGDDWMGAGMIPLSGDVAEALVGMGMPYEEDDGTEAWAPTDRGAEA